MGVEAASNLVTLLIPPLGGPLLDAFFDPIDILMSGLFAFS